MAKKKSSAKSKKMKKSVKKSAKKMISKVKKKKVLAIPKGCHSITPYLIVDNGYDAIEFYQKALGARVKERIDSPGKKIAHAELKIGDSLIMLSDGCPEMDMKGPKAYGGCAVSLCLYVKNVDAVVKEAVQRGAKLMKPVENQFYGDRSGFIEDPFGHRWCIATHIEDVSPAKLKKRAAEFYQKTSRSHPE